MESNLIRKAADIVGSMAELARKLGVSRAAVHQWVQGTAGVPLKYCAAIEHLAGGAVMRWDLRPDDWHLIWPELRERKDAPPVHSEQAA